MSTVVPPLRSLQAAADLPGFFDTVADALALHVKTDGPPDGQTPIFVEDFPKERLSVPGDPFYVVTYRVDSTQMGSTSNDSDRRPRAPLVRDRRPHPNLEGYNLVTYGWWEDAVVVFEIWGKSNSGANSLGNWFHKFMMKYAFAVKYFDGRGVQQFRFTQRLPDEVRQKEGQELYLRQYAYSFRLEFLDSTLERRITTASLSVNGQPLNDLSA